MPNHPPARAAVCRFVRGARWADLPPAVQDKARRALLDNLAALLAGARWRSSRIAADCALELYQPGENLLVADARRASPAAAAFANCVAANAVDLDDVSVYTWGHPGAQVFPVALAFAEAGGCSGAELLTALVVGYEVAFRIGRCMFGDIEAGPQRDYRGCGAWGAVAAAATTAHLTGLSEDAIWHTLGIAEYHAPWAPILEDIANPAMVKHGHGAGAIAGVTAARLALRGFTGTPSRLGQSRFADRVTDIGTHYLLPGRGVEWKAFSCCLFCHPALLAVQQIRHREQFAWADIEHIVVEAHHDARLLPIGLPTSTETAQFSLPWTVAALLVDGELTPRQIAEERLTDPLLRALCGRIEVRASAELDRRFWLAERAAEGGAESARIVIRLRGGRSIDSGIVDKPLEMDGDWDVGRLRTKFQLATRDVLDASASDAVLRLVDDLPQLSDVRELCAVLHHALHSHHE